MTEEQERAAFKVWYFDRFGWYPEADRVTDQDMLEAWQARAALSQPDPLPSDLDEAIRLSEKENAAPETPAGQNAELVKAALNYMSAFGQGLEAHGIPYGEQQIEADRTLRGAIAARNAAPSTIERTAPGGQGLAQFKAAIWTASQGDFDATDDEARVILAAALQAEPQA